MNEERVSRLQHLEDVLKQETKSRMRQEELNSKLQDEYDLLLKKLAEAEVHIDQLRLGGINLDSRQQSSTLHQRLENQPYNPTWIHATTSTASSNGLVNEWARPHVASKKNELSVDKTEDANLNLLPTNRSHQDEDSPLEHEHVSPPTKDPPFYAGHDDDINDDINDYNTPFQLQLSQALSEETTEQLSLSEMSPNCIKMRASAESQHIARIFRIRSLQEHILSLTDKVNSHNFSLDELSRGLDHILLDHERLTKEMGGGSCGTMDAMGHKEEVIKGGREVLENELVPLAQQLKELDSALRSRTGFAMSAKDSLNSVKPPARNLSPQNNTSWPGSCSDISNDSLHSASLPSKYLTRENHLNSTDTSTEMALESHSPLSYMEEGVSYHEESGGYGDREESGGYGDREESGGYGDHKESGGYGDREESGGYGDHKESGGYGDHKESGGYGDREENGGYADDEESEGYADHEESGGYGGHKESEGYADHEESEGYGDHEKSGGYGDHKESEGYADHEESGGYADHEESGGYADHEESGGYADHKESGGYADHKESEGYADHLDETRRHEVSQNHSTENITSLQHDKEGEDKVISTHEHLIQPPQKQDIVSPSVSPRSGGGKWKTRFTAFHSRIPCRVHGISSSPNVMNLERPRGCGSPRSQLPSNIPKRSVSRSTPLSQTSSLPLSKSDGGELEKVSHGASPLVSSDISELRDSRSTLQKVVSHGESADVTPQEVGAVADTFGNSSIHAPSITPSGAKKAPNTLHAVPSPELSEARSVAPLSVDNLYKLHHGIPPSCTTASRGSHHHTAHITSDISHALDHQVVARGCAEPEETVENIYASREDVQRQMPPLTIAAMDILKKELESLREQIIKSESSTVPMETPHPRVNEDNYSLATDTPPISTDHPYSSSLHDYIHSCDPFRYSETPPPSHTLIPIKNTFPIKSSITPQETPPTSATVIQDDKETPKESSSPPSLDQFHSSSAVAQSVTTVVSDSKVETKAVPLVHTCADESTSNASSFSARQRNELFSSTLLTPHDTPLSFHSPISTPVDTHSLMEDTKTDSSVDGTFPAELSFTESQLDSLSIDLKPDSPASTSVNIHSLDDTSQHSIDRVEKDDSLSPIPRKSDRSSSRTANTKERRHRNKKNRPGKHRKKDATTQDQGNLQSISMPDADEGHQRRVTSKQTNPLHVKTLDQADPPEASIDTSSSAYSDGNIVYSRDRHNSSVTSFHQHTLDEEVLTANVPTPQNNQTRSQPPHVSSRDIITSAQGNTSSLPQSLQNEAGTVTPLKRKDSTSYSYKYSSLPCKSSRSQPITTSPRHNPYSCDYHTTTILATSRYDPHSHNPAGRHATSRHDPHSFDPATARHDYDRATHATSRHDPHSYNPATARHNYDQATHATSLATSHSYDPASYIKHRRNYDHHITHDPASIHVPSRHHDPYSHDLHTSLSPTSSSRSYTSHGLATISRHYPYSYDPASYPRSRHDPDFCKLHFTDARRHDLYSHDSHISHRTTPKQTQNNLSSPYVPDSHTRSFVKYQPSSHPHNIPSHTSPQRRQTSPSESSSIQHKKGYDYDDHVGSTEVLNTTPLVTSTPIHIRSKYATTLPLRQCGGTEGYRCDASGTKYSLAHSHLFSDPVPDLDHHVSKDYIYNSPPKSTKTRFSHHREEEKYRHTQGSSPEEDKYLERGKEYLTRKNTDRVSSVSHLSIPLHGHYRNHDVQSQGIEQSRLGRELPSPVVEVEGKLSTYEQHQHQQQTNSDEAWKEKGNEKDVIHARQRLPNNAYSGDSYLEDHVQIVDGSGVNLKNALKLARELRRRSERMRGNLKMELGKKGFL